MKRVEPSVNLVLFRSDWAVIRKFAKFRKATMKKTMHEIAEAILRNFPEFAQMQDPEPVRPNGHPR